MLCRTLQRRSSERRCSAVETATVLSQPPRRTAWLCWASPPRQPALSARSADPGCLAAHFRSARGPEMQYGSEDQDIAAEGEDDTISKTNSGGTTRQGSGKLENVISINSTVCVRKVLRACLQASASAIAAAALTRRERRTRAPSLSVWLAW